ncbi:MAG: UDP-N-acetylmuramoyl-L-alanine--D-glutamate ligase [Firmicutes bacterium]|nr:UDP-N-acetylmuramoyl-L-alanine--D-glutamate ligase [Bacillota bacterium]
MNLQDKKVLVIGLARSGMASVRLLLEEGAKIVVNERRELSQLDAKELAFLQKYPEVEFVGGGHPPQLVDPETFLVIKNPGVPPSLPLLQKAFATGIPVITEVEHAFWHLQGKLVAITGTNGKTTTTALTGEIFKAAGKNTFIAGNIGSPLSAVVGKDSSQDMIVAELSSFQLEGTKNFRPQLAAILNITPDHLDHHGSMEAYREAKAKIFANQRREDVIVLNADNAETFMLGSRPLAQVFYFSRQAKVEQGAYLCNGMIVLRDQAREVAVCRVEELVMLGAHNVENALAAALLAWLGGVSPQVIAEVLKTFPGVAHRLEYVRTYNGVDYVNDSKGTNVDATIKALEAVTRPIVLIAGGYEKGADFTELAQAVQGRVRHAVLMGQVAERLAAEFESAGFTSFSLVGSLDDAVWLAQKQAQAGDVVLLSPACASWDMFKDFEERGDLFKKAVWALGGKLS